MRSNKVCVLFGHRRIRKSKEIELRLTFNLEALILKGYNCFLVGMHGEFDKLALSVLRFLRLKYEIKIMVVVTDPSKLTLDKFGYSKLMGYEDVETISYEIENIYPKNRINYSNKRMVDQADIVLSYIDPNSINSGAKRTVLYAKKNFKKIINIFEEADRAFSDAIEDELNEILKNICNKKRD